MEIALYGILTIVGGGWIGWVSLRIINHSTKIDDLERDVAHLQDNLKLQTARVDSLLKTEAEELKAIMENANANWKDIAQSIKGKK